MLSGFHKSTTPQFRPQSGLKLAVPPTSQNVNRDLKNLDGDAEDKKKLYFSYESRDTTKTILKMDMEHRQALKHKVTFTLLFCG